MSLENLAPDSTTIGRFRNSLIKNKKQKSESRKKVEADNKAIDVLLQEELEKEKPSSKKISKLLKRKAYNWRIRLINEYS